MSKKLRVLIVEDSEDDAELVLNELHNGGYEPQSERVDTHKSMADALKKKAWDVIITDHSMPHFNGFQALELLRSCAIDIPCIVVSGKIGEDIAVQLMKAGANDYVMKGNLNRLAPAIERELRDAHMRRERKQTEEALIESEARYRLLAEHTTDVIRLLDMDLKTAYLSPSAEKLRGFTLQEMVEMPLERQLTPESLRRAYAILSVEIPMVESDPGYNPILTLDLEYYCKDGTTIWTESKFSLIRDENGRAVSILAEARDISERKLAEKKLQESEKKHRAVVEMASDVIVIIQDSMIRFANPRVTTMLGYETGEIEGMDFVSFIPPANLGLALERYQKRMSGEKLPEIYETELLHKSGRKIPVETSGSVIEYAGKPADLAIIRDITERKQSEEKLLKSYESLKKTLNDAINTMVKIMETRDPYTAGHQQKVADLATAIAGEMKLEDTRVDQIRMAAVIHDIGKMYVSSDILSRPGKLSDMELDLIKTHAQSGYDIVKGMDFPGVVAQTILEHHERLDGSGYPNQLQGEDTLLEAKILAVADVVEAMASHRPYRAALGIHKALEEISNERGKLYDPAVVEACLTLFKSGRFEFKPT